MELSRKSRFLMPSRYRGATAQGFTGLAAGRPPTVKGRPKSFTSKASRMVINTQHILLKLLAKAEGSGDSQAAHDLRRRIEDMGGLKTYQQASIQGQAKDRGGDSSIVLMQWIGEAAELLKRNGVRLRMLEVGALSTQNACSKAKVFDIERIDLHSQADGILRQDFMKRPLPTSAVQKFDVVSLSLVLNFVPDAIGRGDMLKRTCEFLDPMTDLDLTTSPHAVFPCLFLVVPAPCITNSRYLDEERLTCIMASLGYVMLQRKQTAKLLYYLLQWRDRPVLEEQDFPKKEVNPGHSRNNFTIIIS